MFEIRKFGRVERERRRPQELAGAAIERPHAAAFADHHRNVALLAARTSGLIHFTNFGSGIDRGRAAACARA